MNQYILYKSTNTNYTRKTGYTIGVQKLGFCHLLIKEESFSLKILLVRLYFFLITLGNSFVYYVVDNDKVVHTSCVLGKCYKFPFLNDNDYEIGPCYTSEEKRGRGIYPDVLCEILHTMSYDRMFIFVSEDNTSSIHGIEKAGFTKVSKISKTKFLKMYR